VFLLLGLLSAHLFGVVLGDVRVGEFLRHDCGLDVGVRGDLMLWRRCIKRACKQRRCKVKVTRNVWYREVVHKTERTVGFPRLLPK
jgi:hypothetical protein